MKIKRLSKHGLQRLQPENDVRPAQPSRARLGILAVGMPLAPSGNGWTWISAPHTQLHAVSGTLMLAVASLAIAAACAQPIRRRLHRAVNGRR